MLPLKVTMQTWKQYWEQQSHNSLKDMWIGASTSYWEMFCQIIGIRVWETIGVLSQTRSMNNLLLMLFFVQGKSQTIMWLFQKMMVDMQLSPLWHMNIWITRFTTQNLNGPTMNVFSCKGETYVNIKLKN